MLARAPFVSSLPSYLSRFDLFLQAMDAIANAAAIGFEFCFTSAAAIDATRETRERGVLTRNQTRQQIFQLRQLNLNFSFFRLRTLREDVEDQLRTIDD